jgi:hypothetical protein
VRSAIDGKVEAIASLPLTVRAKNRQSEQDERAAAFVKWALNNNDRGIHGLLEDMLKPAFLDGWSVGEIVQREVLRDEDKEWAGMWGLRHVKSKDTHWLALQLDQFRNQVGLINLIRGVQRYEPAKVIVYSYNPLFSNPFGHGDCETILREVAIMNDAWKAWYIAIKRFGLPYIHGTYKGTSPQLKEALQQAVEYIYAQGWAVTPEDCKIDVKNLAVGAAMNGFESIINKLREQIYLPIRGAYMPFLEGQSGALGSANSTQIHKAVPDAKEDMITKEALRLINRKIVPYLVRPNFGFDVGLPECSLGAVDNKEAKERLEVIKVIVKEVGLPVSKTRIYEECNLDPPDLNQPDDILGGPSTDKDNAAAMTAISGLAEKVQAGAISPVAAIEIAVFTLKLDREEAAKFFPQPPQQAQLAMPGAVGASGQPQPQVASQGAPASPQAPPGIAEMVRQALQAQPSSSPKAFSQAYEDDSSFGGGMMARGRKLLEEVAA